MELLAPDEHVSRDKLNFLSRLCSGHGRRRLATFGTAGAKLATPSKEPFDPLPPHSAHAQADNGEDQKMLEPKRHIFK